MTTEAIILFEYGTEGGGATVCRLPNNKVIEEGSSGGISGDEDDPVKEWKKEFESWEAWWQNFTTLYPKYWIYFYPVFIHNDIKAFIKQAVENYNYKDRDISRQLENWNFTLTRKV
jgi:hypothetical protein